MNRYLVYTRDMWDIVYKDYIYAEIMYSIYDGEFIKLKGRYYYKSVEQMPIIIMQIDSKLTLTQYNDLAAQVLDGFSGTESERIRTLHEQGGILILEDLKPFGQGSNKWEVYTG